jgi:predicted kinase
MTLYLLCGLAFSGKSTLAEAMSRHLGCAVISLDDINARRGLFGGQGIPVEEWARTHDEAIRELEAALREGRSVVVDDTNCFRLLRDDYRAVAERYGVPSVVIHVDVPLDLALARLRANDRETSRAPVREAILRELAEKLEPPEPDEAVVVFPADASPDAWVRLSLSESIEEQVGGMGSSRDIWIEQRARLR